MNASSVSTADLHMHSTASDGSDTPEELLKRVLASGITTFALTDHDTAKGAEALLPLVPEGVRFFPGIEFSCVSSAGKCHILGYCPEFSHPAFRAAIEEGRQRRLQKLSDRIRFLEEVHGIHLDDAERAYLNSQESPGKPHLARILMDRGLASSVKEGIRTYLKGGPSSRIPAETAVRAILASGGVPVWAHPLGGEGEPRLTTDEFHAQLRLLTGLGIRGLECWYSRYSLEEVRFLLSEAEANRLLVSGGSDCHGSNKDIAPGTLNCENQPVPPEQLTILTVLTQERKVPHVIH